MDNFCEMDLELDIFNARGDANKRGFIYFFKNAKRQFRLSSGQVIDILTWEVKDDCLNAAIVELKRDMVNVKTLLQALRYSDQLFSETSDYFKEVNITIVLVGSEADDSVVELVNHGIDALIYTYNISQGTINFKSR